MAVKSQSLGISGPNPELALGGIHFYCWFETITEIKVPIVSGHGSYLGLALLE